MISAEKGAYTVINNWLQISEDEKVLIITDKHQYSDALLMKKYAEEKGGIVEIIMMPVDSVHPGDVFEKPEVIKKFLDNDIIVGGTTYSLITTKAALRAMNQGRKFLSLPLSTKNGESMLEHDFMEMNPLEAESMAVPIIERINKADKIHVTTERGTDITFSKDGRDAHYFNGASVRKHGFDSASFEIYVAVQENGTNGIAYADGSFGYIGKMEAPVKLQYKNGKLFDIESARDGEILKKYMESFNDEGMYVAAEFGIGLNKISKCRGMCYIEDESAYGTFHIGMGRNTALGGKSHAKGHFDIVFKKPTIYAGDVMIMKCGEFL